MNIKLNGDVSELQKAKELSISPEMLSDETISNRQAIFICVLKRNMSLFVSVL
jgi:hypothetical protein